MADRKVFEALCERAYGRRRRRNPVMRVRVTGNVYDPENDDCSHVGDSGNSGNRLKLLNFVNTSAVWRRRYCDANCIIAVTRQLGRERVVLCSWRIFSFRWRTSCLCDKKNSVWFARFTEGGER